MNKTLTFYQHEHTIAAVRERAEFLLGMAHTWDYCLDAPSYIPAGSTRRVDFELAVTSSTQREH